MSDTTCDQVLEHLATILEQVQGVRTDMIDMKARLQRVELAVTSLEQALVDTEVARLIHQLECFNRRRLGGRGAATGN